MKCSKLKAMRNSMSTSLSSIEKQWSKLMMKRVSEGSYGHQFETRLVLSDSGNGVLRGMTSVERYGDQVVLTGNENELLEKQKSTWELANWFHETIRRTGPFTKGVVVCEIPQEVKQFAEESMRKGDRWGRIRGRIRGWIDRLEVDRNTVIDLECE